MIESSFIAPNTQHKLKENDLQFYINHQSKWILHPNKMQRNHTNLTNSIIIWENQFHGISILALDFAYRVILYMYRKLNFETKFREIKTNQIIYYSTQNIYPHIIFFTKKLASDIFSFIS